MLKYIQIIVLINIIKIEISASHSTYMHTLLKMILQFKGVNTYSIHIN